ncbi:unnamed protein product [Urochloa humidicola]
MAEIELVVDCAPCTGRPRLLRRAEGGARRGGPVAGGVAATGEAAADRHSSPWLSPSPAVEPCRHRPRSAGEELLRHPLQPHPSGGSRVPIPSGRRVPIPSDGRCVTIPSARRRLGSNCAGGSRGPAAGGRPPLSSSSPRRTGGAVVADSTCGGGLRYGRGEQVWQLRRRSEHRPPALAWGGDGSRPGRIRRVNGRRCVAWFSARPTASFFFFYCLSRRRFDAGDGAHSSSDNDRSLATMDMVRLERTTVRFFHTTAGALQIAKCYFLPNSPRMSSFLFFHHGLTEFWSSEKAKNSTPKCNVYPYKQTLWGLETDVKYLY